MSLKTTLLQSCFAPSAQDQSATKESCGAGLPVSQLVAVRKTGFGKLSVESSGIGSPNWSCRKSTTTSRPSTSTLGPPSPRRPESASPTLYLAPPPSLLSTAAP